jgi:hypothetical protein
MRESSFWVQNLCTKKSFDEGCHLALNQCEAGRQAGRQKKEIRLIEKMAWSDKLLRLSANKVYNKIL